jgi:hypothetical protein
MKDTEGTMDPNYPNEGHCDFTENFTISSNTNNTLYCLGNFVPESGNTNAFLGSENSPWGSVICKVGNEIGSDMRIKC